MEGRDMQSDGRATYRFNADHLGGEWHGSSADGAALAERMSEMAEERDIPVQFVWAPGELCENSSRACERYEAEIDAIWQEVVDASERALWQAPREDQAHIDAALADGADIEHVATIGNGICGECGKALDADGRCHADLCTLANQQARQ